MANPPRASRVLTRGSLAVVALVAGALGCRGASPDAPPATGRASSAVAPAAVVSGREPIVGLPCEGCEAVFEDRPAVLAARVRIPPPGEPGAPMVVTGVVRDASGAPAAGIIVYAYQTDATGIYRNPVSPPTTSAQRHGVLRGFVRTGADGRYQLETIRPASYPQSTVPQHIHVHVLEPGRCTYYIDDVMFTDDPMLTLAKQPPPLGRGGNGIATPTGDARGWQVTRDIVLGAAIADYARCAGTR